MRAAVLLAIQLVQHAADHGLQRADCDLVPSNEGLHVGNRDAELALAAPG